jgi:hypothetical protein
MAMKLTIRARRLAALAVTASVGLVAFFAVGAATASSVQANVKQGSSENWAGYVAAGNNFSSVAGTWTVPSVKAASSSVGAYSAAWVGLGGASGRSQSLEQIGTSADYVNGRAEYYAWYELPPSSQVRLNLAIHPGDKMSAKVTVKGTTVTLSLSNGTTGRSVVEAVQMGNPATSSAEWIVEAPAAETAAGNYRILSLADFGDVSFTKAAATAGSHTGGISDSKWSATRLQLSTEAAGGLPGRGFLLARSRTGLPQAGARATASALSGDTFSVSWRAGSAGTATSGGEPAVNRYPYPGGPFSAGGGGYPRGGFSAGAGYGGAPSPPYPGAFGAR